MPDPLHRGKAVLWFEFQSRSKRTHTVKKKKKKEWRRGRFYDVFWVGKMKLIGVCGSLKKG